MESKKIEFRTVRGDFLFNSELIQNLSVWHETCRSYWVQLGESKTKIPILFKFGNSNLYFEILIEAWWAYDTDLPDHVHPKNIQNYEF